MIWFRHECAARHDPRLQILGSLSGAEGLGIYWSLLEEIGKHSNSFQLKILGTLTFSEFSLKNPDPPDIRDVPMLPVNILARNLFTSPRKLLSVIDLSARLGLFDPERWLSLGILYSPAFERRAERYLRWLLARNSTP